MIRSLSTSTDFGWAMISAFSPPHATMPSGLTGGLLDISNQMGNRHGL